LQALYRGGWQSYDLNFGVFSHIITNFGVSWVVKTSPNLNKPKKIEKMEVGSSGNIKKGGGQKELTNF
jgi:hypothetical protein